MNVLFNGTTLVMGGALQVAVAFIKQSIKEEEGIQWTFAISRKVFNELSDIDKQFLKGRATLFDISPAKSNLERSRLATLACTCKADVVFTLFGPAYTRFKVPHVCGVADGWVTHSSLLAFRSLGGGGTLKMLISIFYKAIWYRKSSAWIVEANNAKAGLINRLRINPGSIYVIQNTCGQHYLSKSVSIPEFVGSKKIRLLCLSAYYVHKNLEIIPEVIGYLREMTDQYDFEFLLTLPFDSEGYKKLIDKAKSLNVEKYICNIGPVQVRDGPALYEQSDIVFLPSLLETFSANYPEAMAMSRPIITTDLSHAHDVCKNAALFFEPANAREAAKLILRLVENPEKLRVMINNGKKVLKSLPTPEQRYQQYISVIKSVVGSS